MTGLSQISEMEPVRALHIFWRHLSALGDKPFGTRLLLGTAKFQISKLSLNAPFGAPEFLAHGEDRQADSVLFNERNFLVGPGTVSSGHQEASRSSRAERGSTMRQSLGCALQPRSRSPSERTMYVSGGKLDRRQFETAGEPRPVRAATFDVPPSSSMTALVVVSVFMR